MIVDSGALQTAPRNPFCPSPATIGTIIAALAE